MNTLKILSALLTYPSEELAAAAPGLKNLLARDGLLKRPNLAAIEALIDDIVGRDLFDAQERYILLFDRTRSLSLHLFEHVHGESRDRGQAMVDLIKLYEGGGYTPTTAELPDFLPLFLEYAATRGPAEAIELIGQPGHVLAVLKERLTKRSSPYAAVFAALVALSKAKLDEAALAALREEPDPEPDDLEALDAAWEEEEVTFGPGAAKAACGVDGVASKLRQARRPAPGIESASASGPRTVITRSSATRA